MFRISLYCDSGKYEYQLESYKKSLELSKRLIIVAEILRDNAVIEDFYIAIELICGD